MMLVLVIALLVRPGGRSFFADRGTTSTTRPCSVIDSRRLTCYNLHMNSKNLDSVEFGQSKINIDVVQGPYNNILIRRYWGRKPLVIRNAFDPLSKEIQSAWPSFEDIVKLSTYNDDYCGDHCSSDDDEDSGYSARLIQHIPGKLNSFSLELGPFQREKLERVIKSKKKNWTLLLNDVGRYMVKCQHWMDDTFTFLPRWRRDDAQVSIAGLNGGIGPHVDNYDVLLIQTSGSRLWALNSDQPISVSEEYDLLVPEIPVRILDRFELNVTVLLQPGDLLYVPPRIAHCGTAVDDGPARCMTLSVGFRSPSAAELTARVAESLQQSVLETAVKRYSENTSDLVFDERLNRRNLPAQESITSSTRSKMKELVVSAVIDILDNDMKWDEIIGCTLTEAMRYSENAFYNSYDTVTEGLLRNWGKNTTEDLVRVSESSDLCLIGREGLSFATSMIAVNKTHSVYRLFAHGEMWEVWNDPFALLVFHRIEVGHVLQSHHLQEIHRSSDSTIMLQVLVSLLDRGILRPHIRQDLSQFS